MRWLVAHQGWYFFPILLLEGASLHTDGIRRVISRDKIQRRWVEISLLTLRLGGLALLVFLVLPPEKAFAFLGCSWPYSACTWAPHSRPTTSAPLVSPIEAGFLRRQVLMSRNISGGPLISVFMGGLNYQIEHHLFPPWRDPICVRRSLRRRLLRGPRRPLHPHHALAVLPHRHRLPQHRRTTRQGPLPVPHGCSTPRPLTLHCETWGTASGGVPIATAAARPRRAMIWTSWLPRD